MHAKTFFCASCIRRGSMFRMKTPARTWQLLAFYLLAAAIAGGAEQIRPSPKLPETSPWDLVKLAQPPVFEWVDAAAPVRSLLYEGEPYGSQPTRVFAYPHNERRSYPLSTACKASWP